MAEPSPSFLARSIHGRDEAMGRLDGLVAGGGALALVGEGGIGKTRLARWTTERADRRRMAVTEGTATLGLAEPLGVLRDLVRGARRAGVEPPMRDPLAASLPAMVLPELGGTGLDQGNLGAVFEAAARYLTGLGGGRGALVVLEDLHWADATSLSLAAFLARTLPGADVALLMTYRPDDHTGSPALEGLRVELRRARLADEVVLGPLGPDDADAMLAEILGGLPAPDVTAELLRLSGGNPFALEELTRAVVESGWLDLTTGRRRGTSGVELPWTLAESIRARAAALAPGEREIATWAAVIGPRFDARLLARASGMDPLTVLDGLDALARAGFVGEVAEDPDGELFAFRHALVHEALATEGLGASRRARHAAALDAAEALRDEGLLAPSSAELARQAMAAGDRARTLTHSRHAIVEAQEVGAVEEAVEHLERALSLWNEDDGPVLRAELLFACGRLRVRLARGDDRAVDLLEMARDAYRALDDEDAVLWCLAVLADARLEVGDRPAALADFEEAVPRLRDAGHGEALRTALVGYSRALALEGRTASARQAADEGLAMVPRVTTGAEASERANLLITRGMIALWDYQPDAARPLLDEAIALAMATHDDVCAARAHHILAEGGLPFEPVAGLIGHARTARELVGRHGLRGLEAFYCVIAGELLVMAGDWEGAGRAIAETEDLLDEGQRIHWTRDLHEINRTWQLFGLGALEDAQARGDALAERALAQGSRTLGPLVQHPGAEVSVVVGDLEGAARRIAPTLAQLDLAIGHGDVLFDDTVFTAVAVLVAVGETTSADRLATTLTSRSPHGFAAAARALIAVGTAHDVAAADAAAAELDALGQRLAAARLYVLGSVIAAARPDGRRAAVPLARAALERFAAMGSEAWCRRLEGMLRSWGERAPTRAGPGAGGVSKRELEVLALVAEGLTNREIAERLVISEHTAVRHVSNLMAKLGAPSRAAAVRIAGERGLLADEGGRMASPAGTE